MKKWFTNWTKQDWDDFYVTAFGGFAVALVFMAIYCAFAGLDITAIVCGVASFFSSIMFCLSWKERDGS